jgi:hypothetical protein
MRDVRRAVPVGQFPSRQMHEASVRNAIRTEFPMSKYQAEEDKTPQLVPVAQYLIDAGAGYLTRPEVCEFPRISRSKFPTPLKQGELHQFSTVAWPASEIRGPIEAQRKEGQHARA